MEHELEILEGKVARDHVHLLIAYRPHQSISMIAQWLKGISSRMLLEEFAIEIGGGLGPTSDDITRDAASAAFNRKLRVNAQALKHIQDRFHLLRRETAPTNIKQAMFPEGSVPLKNNVGTAWGFRLQYGKATIFFLPGVPGEFRWMLAAHIFHDLEIELPIAERSEIGFAGRNTQPPADFLGKGWNWHFRKRPSVHRSPA
jgi:molybdopterin-biosynthesis enzyme MoeA-like protein